MVGGGDFEDIDKIYTLVIYTQNSSLTFEKRVKRISTTTSDNRKLLLYIAVP